MNTHDEYRRGASGTGHGLFPAVVAAIAMALTSGCAWLPTPAPAVVASCPAPAVAASAPPPAAPAPVARAVVRPAYVKPVIPPLPTDVVQSSKPGAAKAKDVAKS